MFVGRAILTVLRTGWDLTTAQIGRAAEISAVQATHGATILARRGLISPALPPASGAVRYRITKEGVEWFDAGKEVTSGPTGRTAHHVKQASLREKIWRALTIVRKGTMPELLALARTGGERQAENNARKYLAALHRAGYIVPLPARRPGTSFYSRGFLCWLLVKDTGMRAPVYCSKKRVVFDPNTNEEVSVSCQSRGPNCYTTQSSSTEALRR